MKSKMLVALACMCLGGCNIQGNESTLDPAFRPGLDANPPEPFTESWPFDALTTGDYVFDSSVIRFNSGVAELRGTVQTDSEATEITDGTLSAGTYQGVVYDTLTDGTTEGLKLGNGGGCDGGSTDCAKSAAAEIYELHSSWTPQWANLLSYFSFMSHSGLILNSDNISAKVGANAVAVNTDNVGTMYSPGLIASGLFTDTTDAYIQVPFASAPDISGAQSVSMWVKGDASNLVAWQQFWSKEICCTSGWSLQRNASTNGISLRVNTDAGGNQRKDSSDLTVLNGTWKHVVVTFLPGTIKLYLNGVLTNTWAYSHGSGLSTAANYKPGGHRAGVFVDEVAYWNVELSAGEIQTICDRQKIIYSGTFTSRIMDAKSSSSWITLSWIPTLPFLKELPDYSSGAIQNETSDSSTGYSSLVGSTGTTAANDLMTGIVGLWHLDEASGTTGAGSIIDDSGGTKHGTPTGGVSFGGAGRLGSVANFDGSNDFITIPAITAFDSQNQFTVCLWFNGLERAAGWDKLFSSFDKFFFSLGDNNDQMYMGRGYPGSSGAGAVVVNGIVPGTFYHFCMSYDGATTAGYQDGAFLSSYADSFSASTAANSLFLGRAASGGWEYTKALVDEIAIWSRALHPNEIKQVYQRGASRIKYQVRSCDDNACSGENWQGPDGTSGTYFSELNNNTTPLTGAGDVKATLPSMFFSNFTSAPSANQYFQYRTILGSDSATAALMPELKSTTIDPIHYPSYATSNTTPGNTIIGVNGVAFFDLGAYTETLGAGVCTSGVVYNIGASNTGPWKYWTGATWATSDGSADQASSAATINTNIAAYGTQFGVGTVFFKAFLKSSGTSKCELGNIEVGGNR